WLIIPWCKTIKAGSHHSGHSRNNYNSEKVYLLLTLAWVIVPKRRVGAFINDGEESSTMKEIFAQYGTYSTDMSDIANGYLETIIGLDSWKAAAIPRGSTIVLNTFDALEHDSVNALTVTNPRAFNIGPLDMMQQHFWDERLKQLGSNLWKEI
ncbi:hypothetical protein Tco_0779482, partial [Tanacetum coccineum]